MVLLLWCLYFVLEISAEETAKTLYGLESHSVCLDAGGQPPYKSAKWTKNPSTILTSDHNTNPDYTKKIHYHKSNEKLCIRNLTKKDDGIYTFSYELNFKHIVNKYKLTVQDAVPEPALNITAGQANSSHGLCIFRVNCSVQHHWLWSECGEDGCQTPHKSFSQLNITISAKNRSVICTGSNHVSGKKASQDIADLCSSTERQESPKFDPEVLIVIIVVTVLLVVITVLVSFAAKKLFLKKCKDQPQVIRSEPLEQPSQPRVSTSSNQAEADYENIDPQNTNHSLDQAAVGPNPEEQNHEAHTVYCVLEPQQAAASKDTEKTQQTEEMDESNQEMEDSNEVNTVYRVLQKPKV